MAEVGRVVQHHVGDAGVNAVVSQREGVELALRAPLRGHCREWDVELGEQAAGELLDAVADRADGLDALPGRIGELPSPGTGCR